jgi:hypothetical protein
MARTTSHQIELQVNKAQSRNFNQQRSAAAGFNLEDQRAKKQRKTAENNTRFRRSRATGYQTTSLSLRNVLTSSNLPRRLPNSRILRSSSIIIPRKRSSRSGCGRRGMTMLLEGEWLTLRSRHTQRRSSTPQHRKSWEVSKLLWKSNRRANVFFTTSFNRQFFYRRV